jgi:hypothetical protein
MPGSLKFNLTKFLKEGFDREPIVMLSCALGAAGLSMPIFVPPIRSALGYDTYQSDMVPHPGGSAYYAPEMFVKGELGEKPAYQE